MASGWQSAGSGSVGAETGTLARAADEPTSLTTPATVRIVVVDDHAIVRLGVRVLLGAEPGLEVVGEAADVEQAIRCARLEKPDVIVLDLVLPGRNGLEAVGEIVEASGGARVIVFSVDADPLLVRRAFAEGVSGYVTKEAAEPDLVTAVREVARGNRYLHPALGARLALAEAEAQRREAESPLSDRERDIFLLLARGHTNLEIANLLEVSIRTVETHRAHIMQKLGVATRAELVTQALALHWLT